MTNELYSQMLEEEMDAIREEISKEAFENGRFEEAVKLFDEMIRGDEFREFLTLPAYEYID